jgi:hypothetical protein
MSRFEHDDLPPDLGFVADQLRSHRYEASALELDQAKTRILRRARVARGGHMPKRSLLTALIMVVAIGTGSSAALALSGVAPFSGLLTPRAVSVPAATVSPSAASAQYCAPDNIICAAINLVEQILNQVFGRPGQPPFAGALQTLIDNVLDQIANQFGNFFGGGPGGGGGGIFPFSQAVPATSSSSATPSISTATPSISTATPSSSTAHAHSLARGASSTKTHSSSTKTRSSSTKTRSKKTATKARQTSTTRGTLASGLGLL